MNEPRRLASPEALRVGFPTAFYLLPLFIPMAIPKTVQHWLNLRREYERQRETNPDSPTPRVLPIVKIGRTWYFEDERLHELRNVEDPHDAVRFRDGDDFTTCLYWTKQLQPILGKRVVSAKMEHDDLLGYWAPVIRFSDGQALMLLADEEGNGPGRFAYLED